MATGTETYSFVPSLTERTLISAYKFVNRFVAWHKLPALIGAFNLSAFRTELNANNLHDGYASGSAQGETKVPPAPDNQRDVGARNSEGKFNSLDMPLMGCAGMRFGRNVPRSKARKPTDAELMTPNPRVVSEEFMARKEKGFIPATSLNLLAAAWIQFQVHDWFFHESEPDTLEIPLPKGDSWSGGRMTLPKSKPDDTLHPSDEQCPGYKNLNTHWWDCSQLYGSSEAVTEELRTKDPDGKLLLTKLGTGDFVPRDENGNPKTGFNTNWWIGMEILHTLFALEHNAVCDKLRAKYPTWTGDQIFDKARLVTCALVAKIHTIEWTPAILAHPALQLGMAVNWWGFQGPALTKKFGRLTKTSDIISGIPGSGADQHGTPYSLTEEFVSVYRMHSLIPDRIAFFDSADGAHKRTVDMPDMLFDRAAEQLQDATHPLSFADALYSFGINYPGAITNNNYPEFLRNLSSPDGVRRDLGTVDILRDRERGVPRYCEFRRLLHMEAPKTFEELTGGDAQLAARLSAVYEGDIEKVDALVGCHSEPLPKGFGFSDTAFRIFIVMASRRIKSDRFLATDWTKEMYTPEGLAWVQNTTMKDVLIRHYPGLKKTLDKSKNVFAPWDQMPASKKYKGIETNI